MSKQNFDSALPVLPIALRQPVEPGRLDRNNAAAVIESIDLAIEMVARSQTNAIVTNPIHKVTLKDIGFAHPGLVILFCVACVELKRRVHT